MRMQIARMFSAAMLAGTLAGCAEFQDDALYYETYEIKHLTVIILDDKALQRRWQYVSGKPASQATKFMVGADQMNMSQTVQGFFDFKTNTIYCTKMNFEVCGHELFHAIKGRFHQDP